jgi:MoxR-like ATPase
MLHVSMKLPLEEEWLTILNRTTTAESPQAEAVLDSARLLQMRADACEVLVAESVQRYLVRLVLATHPESEFSTELVRRYVRFGASPRAAQAILRAARVRALRQGNWHVSMEDARAFAMGALRHRLGLSFRASGDGVTVEAIVEDVLRSVCID